jgi:hypothetical protein
VDGAWSGGSRFCGWKRCFGLMLSLLRRVMLHGWAMGVSVLHDECMRVCGKKLQIGVLYTCFE